MGVSAPARASPALLNVSAADEFATSTEVHKAASLNASAADEFATSTEVHEAFPLLRAPAWRCVERT